MPQPPPAPPSSDIAGVDRDQGKSFPRDKAPEPDQQEKLADVHDNNAARPPYDDDITMEGNSR